MQNTGFGEIQTQVDAFLLHQIFSGHLGIAL
jgi:hypothetical protein